MQEKYYQFEVLEDVISLYTKIPFNFSRKFNKREDIDRQFKEIENDIGYPLKMIKYMKQVHQNNIKIVRDADLLEECYEGYDGLITNIAGVALTTITADCQAIFLYDKKNKVIGNIHSGWKGTLNRIGKKAIEMMIEEYGSSVEDIIVCINPSILKCCFEVEIDVVDKYKNEFTNIDEYIRMGEVKEGKQKYYIDTVGINKREFLKLGILEKNIYIADICTKCNCNVYHSFRNEGMGTGQNLALIMLK